MQRDTTPRALGPYKKPNGTFRVVLKGADGCGDRRRDKIFDNYKEARQWAERFNEKAQSKSKLTLNGALQTYLDYQKVKGSKASTVETLGHRLRSFFPEESVKRTIGSFTPTWCQKLYTELTRRVTRLGRPTAADTHRSTLKEVKRFFDWLVKERYCEKNPAADIEETGRKRRGKPQLRVDEARALYQMAEKLHRILLFDDPMPELAALGIRPPGWFHGAKQLPRYRSIVKAGIASTMTALILGLRAGEVIGRKVRDLDDNATKLWVGEACEDDLKTEASYRLLEVPELLRPYLTALTEGKAKDAPLFQKWSDDPQAPPAVYDACFVRYWSLRLTRLAGVRQVCAHGLRGSFASIAASQGIASGVVARELGQSGPAVAEGHYIKQEARHASRTKHALTVLTGGKTQPDTNTVAQPLPGK